MYFPTKYLRPYPQNHSFIMQNLLYTELSVRHTLMELRSQNFAVINLNGSSDSVNGDLQFLWG